MPPSFSLMLLSSGDMYVGTDVSSVFSTFPAITYLVYSGPCSRYGSICTWTEAGNFIDAKELNAGGNLRLTSWHECNARAHCLRLLMSCCLEAASRTFC